MKKTIMQIGEKMRVLSICLRKLACFKFRDPLVQSTKFDHLGDIRNLDVPISFTPKNISEVIFIVTEVTKQVSSIFNRVSL
jgi:hypothetical protein